MPVIDTHCHMLPCIDDGSKSVEESLRMLRMMKAGGVDVAVATPHFYAAKKSVSQFLEDREKSFEQIKGSLDDSCPRLICGAEVAYYINISRLENLEKLCVEGTNTLLLELPMRTAWGDCEYTEIQNIVLNRGLNVVIAHYERYRPMQGKNPFYDSLLELPVYIQITARELGGLFKGKENLNLFRSGRAQLLGSDAHNMTDRLPDLDKGRTVIKNKLGQSILDEIDKCGEKLFL